MLVVGGVIWAVVSMVFATLGGLLGALMFRRKGGPTAGLPTAPPPTFTPPTFTPPAPVAPPPPFMPPPPSPPPAPPMRAAAGRRRAAAEQLAGAADGRPVRRRRADDHDPGPRSDPAAVAEAARSAGAACRRRCRPPRPRARFALTAVTAPGRRGCHVAADRSVLARDLRAPDRGPHLSAVRGVHRRGARQRSRRLRPRRRGSGGVLGRLRQRARVDHAVHARARVGVARREVVRRRPPERRRPTASIATSARRAATRPRSSGKASPATAARSPTSISTAT